MTSALAAFAGSKEKDYNHVDRLENRFRMRQIDVDTGTLQGYVAQANTQVCYGHGLISF